MAVDLIVHHKFVNIPMIGVRPAEFPEGIPSISVSLDRVRATLIPNASFAQSQDRYPLMSGNMDIVLSDEPDNASDLMASSLPYQTQVREKIHAAYQLLYTRYEYFVRKIGLIRYMPPDAPSSLASLFSDITNWKYKIGDGQ